ncbi:MAG: flagellin FliC [Bdellovibrionales bacterium]|nr:flagellin FliC [Bdellovibrionales bacterium]
MGLRINTNVQSLVAQRNLGMSNEKQRASLEKIASGTRIARAADDAAGLAIAEKMKADIRSLRQAGRNANDGISLVQVAEGGMNEISNILTRFRELSIQGASDTIGERERGFINKEVMQLRSEIDRIAATTEFNGRKLLVGEGDKLEVQVGLNNSPEFDRFVYDTQKLNVTAHALGVADVSTETKEASQQNLAKIDGAIKQLSENRSEVGALQNRLASSVNNIAIYEENLSAAKSRIYDVDMAVETSELTKSNILTQAGTSVLSQANNNSMSALKLLS